ncbi:hypothetical protein [Algoriphagus sp.]|uniref:hypothetical protein n=1 Tax=Algoriphagus sp. TaxID=1872435 RepID=UPI002620C1DE|nr:hypothetical protein [Algoriphagus sp.]
MKLWKSLLILVLITSGGLAAYWVYDTYFAKTEVKPLDLISQDAVFVFESEQGSTTWNALVEHPSWEIFQSFPAFQKISSQLQALDSLTGNSGQISKILSGNTLTVSYHSIGADSFDLLYTLSASTKTGPNLLDELKSKLPRNSKINERKYSDQPVFEYFDASNTRVWTFSFLGPILIISQSSAVVEEAIRHYLNPELITYHDLISANSSIDYELGRLWVNSQGIKTLMSGTLSNRDQDIVQSIGSFSALAGLELFLDEGQLRFEGPVWFPDTIDFTPSIQANISQLEQAISARAIAVTQINLGSIFETQKLVNRAFPSKSTLAAEIQRNLLDKGLLDDFTGEIYLLDLEPYGGSSTNKALLVRSKNTEAAISLFSEYLMNTEGETTGDFYAGRDILFIDEEEFPAYIFGGKFMGFEQTYLAEVDELLIFANTQQSMKLILDDIQSGNTWANANRAPEGKIALTPTAGFSKIILTKNSWDKWIAETNSSWRTFLQKYQSAFQAFPYLSFRINQLADGPKASLTIPFQSANLQNIASETSSVSMEAQNRIGFDARLTYGPKVAINHLDLTEDLVVQNENQVVYQVNSAGEIVYSVPLDGPIISDLFQVDYYRNNKLQILFATQNSIYGIDRLGNPLPNYPIKIPGEQITHLNLVDYDNNKNYRYFVATQSGNLYLLDKTGKQLEGWNPLSTTEPLVNPPSHLRVPGQGDFMVSLSPSGNLNLFNRRGEYQAGSPISLGNSFSSGMILERNPNSGAFQLVGVTQSGEVVRVNFNGEITYRNQLIKEDRDSEFMLIPDQKNQDYLILTRNYNQVKVMDRQENELFTARVSEGDLDYQYFDFGGKRQIVVITDLTQEFSYLYNKDGDLLTQLPPESSGTLHISYLANQGKLLIRTIAGNYLTTYQLSE